MRTAIAIGIMFSFIGIAVFGFMAMSHKNGHGYSCIANMAGGINCPDEDNIADFVSFHVSAFKEFSTALLEQSAVALLFALFLLVIGSRILHAGSLVIVQSPLRTYEKLLCPSPFSPSKTELIHWLALHENSPSFSYAER